MIDGRIKLFRENIYLLRFTDITLEKLVTNPDLVSDYRYGIPVYIERQKEKGIYRFGFLKPELLHTDLITPGAKFDILDEDVLASGVVR